MRPSLLASALLALLVACGSPAMGPAAPVPEIDSLTPGSGLWGTSVTISGSNFGLEAGGGDTVAFTGGNVGANGFVVDTWHDNEVRGRVAFPATGEMAVSTPAGTTMAGTFTTTTPWVPSDSFDVTNIVTQSVLSTGVVVAIAREHELTNLPTLAVFTGSDTGAYELDGLIAASDTTSPVLARIVEADDHSPEVIATKTDGTVVALTIATGAIVSTATGLSGKVVATGRDATGLYVWLDGASGLVRARPAATTWTTDRGPIASANAPLDGAVGSDGTLTIVVSDATGFTAIAQLGPTDTTLGTLERTSTTAATGAITAARLSLAADGIHAVVSATATAALTPRVRTAANTWSDAPALANVVDYGFIGTTLAAITNDSTADTTSLVTDASMASTAVVIPVWPMQTVGFVVSAGAAYPLITNSGGSVVYSLTPPAP